MIMISAFTNGNTKILMNGVENMIVCEHCLMAIESHEGNQIKKKLDWEDECTRNEDEEVFCEWCEEYCDESEMWII